MSKLVKARSSVQSNLHACMQAVSAAQHLCDSRSTVLWEQAREAGWELARSIANVGIELKTIDRHNSSK